MKERILVELYIDKLYYIVKIPIYKSNKTKDSQFLPKEKKIEEKERK